MYRPLPAQVDLPSMEREVLDFWDSANVFHRAVEQTVDGPTWVFYEGPPTANGMPGTHHVEARVFKDVFPRYRTMRGYHVPRRAGWDCHGLPVEIAIEKELGFAGKPDIEEFGVAEFNARCRESVLRHIDEFEAMTRRMGYWVDTSEAYRTMDPAYVESVWWSLKQIWDKGLLTSDYRVAPYCPRCGTTLSDHELAQGYETVVDPSVYVRFPLTSGPLAGTTDLLVWTTTPWTLVSNTAVALHPDVDYVVATRGEDSFVVAEPLVEAALGEGWTVGAHYRGRDLERWTYQRPFDLVDIPDAHYVVLADYVTTEDGTGLVHQSPAFGADDLTVCRAYGLPVVNPLRSDGTFEPSVALVGGLFFKKADETLVQDLTQRGVLFRHVEYEHAYPHCWRCHTPLLYYAQPSWYVRTTAVKDALLRENERTNWYPETIKWGRYGDWLRNNVDWALSRSRFWGTPLPIWVNDADPSQMVCVGSLAELSEHAGQDLSALDPHRPFVDDVSFTKPGVEGTFRRVPEVIDVWYDSGSMPFAQWGYPHAEGSVEAFKAAYPAQYICEALDQTRGWFYSLMAIGTLVFDRSSYENVLCLGLILSEDGRRMSKHLGNILEPIPLMDEHGADAVRWFMLVSGSPWQPRKVGHAALQEVVRKVLLTYWNTASFLSLYGRAAGYEPGVGDVAAVADRPALDRWALSEAHRMLGTVETSLEVYDATRAGRAIAAYIDDLSNWYVRRSRRRFWEGDLAALATLHECLRLVTLASAPLVPFVTERVWRDLYAGDRDVAESVHLAAWPERDGRLVDDVLAGQVALVRRIVELGRAARAESKVRTRQPLQRALIAAAGWDALPADLADQVADELNVIEVASLTQSGDDLVDSSVKANFRALGKRYGRDTPLVAAAVAAADPTTLTHAIRQDGMAVLAVAGVGEVEISADDVVVTETPRAGWAVAREGETVALDLAMSPDLLRAGLAREVVRAVQEARKASSFDITDRITLSWSARTDTAEAIRSHEASIAAEVLATRIEEAPGGASDLLPGQHHDSPDLGLAMTLSVAGR